MPKEGGGEVICTGQSVGTMETVTQATEDHGFILSTHMAAHIPNSTPWVPNAHFWPLQEPGKHMVHIHAGKALTYTQTK